MYACVYVHVLSHIVVYDCTARGHANVCCEHHSGLLQVHEILKLSSALLVCTVCVCVCVCGHAD